MRVARLTALIVATLTACSSEVRTAQRERDILANDHASADLRCAAERKLQFAYLHVHDEENYRLHRVIADTACGDIDFQAAMNNASSVNLQATPDDMEDTSKN